jgi:virginiamycin B lyase
MNSSVSSTLRDSRLRLFGARRRSARLGALLAAVGLLGPCLVGLSPAVAVAAGQVSPAVGTPGQVTALVGTDKPTRITTGPDGALWFTNVGNNTIGRITTSGQQINTFTGAGISDPEGITTGPDGALWFTNEGNNSIGRITTAGVITNYTAPDVKLPDAIVTASDNALWFRGNESIMQITTSGTITDEHTGPAIQSGIDESIAIGADGALWFTNYSGGPIDIGDINRFAP